MNTITGHSLNNTQISLRQHTSTIHSTIITLKRIISITSHTNTILNISISSINSSQKNQTLRLTINKVKTRPNTTNNIKSTNITFLCTINNQSSRNSISHTNIQSIIRTMISNSNSPPHNSTITNLIIRNQLNNR